MSETILLIEDNRNFADTLKFNLVKEGYNVEVAYDGEEGLSKALNLDVDLILLDVMLPHRNGFEIAKLVKQKKQTPIIMLTALGAYDDKEAGHEAGADEYLDKADVAGDKRELLLRIKANLRRSRQVPPVADEKHIIRVGKLTIDTQKLEVRKGDDILNLSSMEYELLMFFINHPNEVHTRPQLLAAVWGYEYSGGEGLVNVTIHRLREEIEDDPSEPMIICTRRSKGYYLNGL